MGNVCCKDSSEQSLIIVEKVSLLFNPYYNNVLGIKQAKIFKEDSPQLKNFIDRYLLQQPNLDQNSDFQLRCIDIVMKIHPTIFLDKQQIGKQQLLAACIRFQNFCDAVPNQKINFYPAYQKYLKFLKLCRSNPTNMIVPTLQQQLIWQAHMQDHDLYVKDMQNYFGALLTRQDLIPQQSLKQYYLQTLKLREQLQRKSSEFVTKKYEITTQDNQNSIKYFSGALITTQPENYQQSGQNLLFIEDSASTFSFPILFNPQSNSPHNLQTHKSPTNSVDKVQFQPYQQYDDNDGGD